MTDALSVELPIEIARRIAEHMGYCPHSTPEDERAGELILTLLRQSSEEQERGS